MQSLHLPPTVHKDVTDRLKSINPHLYREVGIVLEQNKQERHMRGGEATKQKYLHLKQTVTQENDDKFAFSAEIADEK